MAAFDIDDIVQSLQTVRRAWREKQRRSLEPGGRDLPAREALAQIIGALKGVLFPMRLGPPDLRQESENFYVAHALDAALNALLAQVTLELRYAARQRNADAQIDEVASTAVQAFATRLPDIRRLLDSDVLAAFHGDPAAGSVDEVLLCYPGILAMIHHRLAHELYRLGLPLLARIIAEQAHAETGIDIHPGARIGGGFFIDHGTGVVIGETAIIGERVRVYQAVTLGAKRFPRDAAGHLEKGLARHPIVEDDVVIYAGATILGRVTIGRGAVIGGNVWLTQDVPAGANVTQAVLRSEANTVPRTRSEPAEPVPDTQVTT
ncbi:serine acetyltransferase [Burkholderia sp. Bp9031]|uniref:serine O-acetyltransferase EpsC n=1 Tax=Burkholderia sp. Bp9031 TaxID=2184566 RepID=UPI0007164C33|nr:MULTISPECIES: serine O-acetyltransferase EpsC [Burkholderia]RQZ06507.1 serine acetyltransferase [Burkholderia sp. Bp9031]